MMEWGLGMIGWMVVIKYGFIIVVRLKRGEI